MHKKEDVLSCPVESEHDCEIALPSQPPVKVRQNLDSPEDKPCGGAWPLSEESEEGQDCSNVSSVWGSAVLEVESPGRSQGEAHGSWVDDIFWVLTPLPLCAVCALALQCH